MKSVIDNSVILCDDIVDTQNIVWDDSIDRKAT